MIAIGPMYPEEQTFTAHKGVRDVMAGLEGAVAAALRQRGFTVLGKHSVSHAPDPSELNEVLALIEKKLANRLHNSELGYLTESTE